MLFLLNLGYEKTISAFWEMVFGICYSANSADFLATRSAILINGI